ncbi:YihY/virulence factor BrkB family protein [uncultured Phycicoccus sp.]|uniref:YihY/virulence factor BrkB family protein n=1 Tax=uncultured Phycicoccus sp. TaxID=661422 RepID=UPI00262919D7|nr:YihY/virulence factor BrkB family protein [uncultured Phycicoccus sp.]
MPTEGSAAAKAATAPPPDTDAKPDSPTELSGRGWKYTFKSAVAEFQRDQSTDLAAALTYYSVLSVAPALLALVSLLGLFGNGAQTVDQLLSLLVRLGQGQVVEQLRGPLEEMVASQAAGFTFVIGILAALFSASGYVGAFGRAMNRVYGVDEGRPVWKLRPANFAVTVALVVLGALVLVGLVVTGPVTRAVGGLIGVGQQAVDVWDLAKWPVILVVVMGMVAMLYYFTPNVRQPKFRWISPGAVLAILVWVVASIAFGFYVSNFGNYNATYGSLGGVIVFLLWLWLTNIALLLGAELDAELERARQLEAGIAAERSIQLPPRDTTQSEKAREKLDERIAQGRAIRRDAAVDAPAGGRAADSKRGQRTGTGQSVTLEALPSEVARRRGDRPSGG